MAKKNMHPNSLENLKKGKSDFKAGEDERRNKDGRPVEKVFTLLKEIPKEVRKELNKGIIAEITTAALVSDTATLKKILAKEENKASLTQIEKIIVGICYKQGKDARQLTDLLKLCNVNYDKEEVNITDEDGYDKAYGKWKRYLDANCTPKIRRDILNNDSQNVITYGGRNSGKSHGIAQAIIDKLISRRNFRGLLVRKVRATIKYSQYQLIIDIVTAAGMLDFFDFNNTELTVTCTLTKNFVKGHGLDKPVKSLTGFNFAWYEEPNTDKVTYNDFTTLDFTLRSKDVNSSVQSMFSFNSDDPSSWLKDEFFPNGLLFEQHLPQRYRITPNAGAEFTTSIIHFTYKDNPYITQEQIDKLERLQERSPLHYKVWTLGLWGGDPQGKIYQNWDIIEKMPYEVANETNTFYGIDWGFNDETVLIEAIVYDSEIYLREHFYASGKLPSDLKDYILANCNTSSRYYADHRPENNAVLVNENIICMPAKKGKSKVEAITMVKKFKLHIEQNSVNLIKEIRDYSWVFNDKLNRYTDIPIGINDHAMDAMLYSIVSPIENKQISYDI
jgi:phage terminase large subunit